MTDDTPGSRARALIYRGELEELDYRREMVAMTKAGMTRQAIADQFHVTQSSVSDVLAKMRDDWPVPGGFCGATPLEICKRFAAGMITRDELIDQLCRYPYTEPWQADSDFEDIWGENQGSVDELHTALARQILDYETFRAILAAARTRRAKTAPHGELVPRSMRYIDTMPLHIPRSLDELHGPTAGMLQAPLNIWTAPDFRFNLDDAADFWALYSATVRDGTPDDQTEILDKDTLIRLWPDLNLPTECRAKWEHAFADLNGLSTPGEGKRRR
jgi:hypothetical protein